MLVKTMGTGAECVKVFPSGKQRMCVIKYADGRCGFLEYAPTNPFVVVIEDKEGNEIHLVDSIEQCQPDMVEEMETDSKKCRVAVLLEEKLTEREREIMLMRYGLGGREELTQNEIGGMLGISRSYVSRIEKKALQKLREGFKENLSFYGK
jgi:RNA polymerase sporulation-specific sigma factor